MDKNKISADAGADVDAGNRVEGPQEAQEGALTIADVNMSGLEEKAPREADNGVREQKAASKPKKQHGKGVLIGFLVFLTLISVGFGVTGMVLWWQEKNKPIEKIIEERTEVVEKITEVDKTTTAKDLKLSKEKWINSDGTSMIWADAVSFDGLNEAFMMNLEFEEITSGVSACDSEFVYKQPETILLANVNWRALYEFFNMNRQAENKIAEDLTIADIDARRVVSIEKGTFGNAPGNETFLFLMDDGTVECMPLHRVAEDGVVRSYGKIEGVEDVISLKGVYSSPGCGGGGTVIAQKTNGEFYDLYGLLEVQNAWGWQ